MESKENQDEPQGTYERFSNGSSARYMSASSRHLEQPLSELLNPALDDDSKRPEPGCCPYCWYFQTHAAPFFAGYPLPIHS